ncbi:prolyl oligopeptidase family-domain-containing protein [Gorgonomyces haynaldii]|nr:prolyl oligopeptidase family-domain-containing protein [Gorgonomyces haynaldii]
MLFPVHQFSVYRSQILYTRLDDQLQVSRVYGFDPKTNKHRILYEASDNAFVDLSLARDKSAVIISVSNDSQSETLIYDGQMTSLGKGDYIAECMNGIYIVRDNKLFLNNQLLFDPKDKLLLNVVLTTRYALLTLSKNLERQFLVLDLKSLDVRELILPFPMASVDHQFLVPPEENKARLVFSHPLLIESRVEVNLETLETDVTSWRPLGMDLEKYEMERLWIGDGVKIPATLVRERGATQRPCIVQGYGAYGEPMEPRFRLDHAYLLKQGWSICLAHVRGGNELGKQWHQSGRQMHKQNSISDFVSVSEHLKNSGIAKHLYGVGASAGGLLVAAAVNQKPDLYKGYILRVPFLDPYTTLLEKGPLAGSEASEWGDIHDPQVRTYIHSYSPLQQLKKTPAKCLISLGTEDQRINNAHTLSYVHKKQQLGDHVLLKQWNRGHISHTVAFEELAAECDFLLACDSQS